MSETINVNGLSLTHKGNGGFSAATLPDVCKTPGGGVPIPYPNVSFARDLINGTATVVADGGNMIAIKGSEYFKSIGDQPGSMGGVVSNTFMKESKWILYSFDVFMEGANTCRLTDPKTQNHANTVDMAGETHVPVSESMEMMVNYICEQICECDKKYDVGVVGQKLKDQCLQNALKTKDNFEGTWNKIKPQIPYNMTTEPPSPIMSLTSDPLKPTQWLPNRTKEIPDFEPGTGMVRRPDAVIVQDGTKPPTQDNLQAVVEVKFDDRRDPEQIQDYQRIAGDKPVIELDSKKCGCTKEKRNPEAARRLLIYLAMLGLMATGLGEAGAAGELGGALGGLKPALP